MVTVTTDQPAWRDHVPLDVFDRYGLERVDHGADLEVTIALEVVPLSRDYEAGSSTPGGRIRCATGAATQATLSLRLPARAPAPIETIVAPGFRREPSGAAVVERKGLTATCGPNPVRTDDLLQPGHVLTGVFDLLDRIRPIGSDLPSSRATLEASPNDVYRSRAWAGLDRQLAAPATRDAAVEAVAALLAHLDPRIWQAALERLEVAREPRALDARIAALTDRDRAPSVARSFAAHPHPRAFDPLVAALGQLDGSSVEAIAVALGASGDERAAAPLLSTLARLQLPRDTAAVGELTAALCKYPRQAQTYRAGLAHGSALVRAGAARALACTKDRASVPLLVPLLRDPDPHVASATAVALGQLGGDAATGALIEILPAATAAVREAALRGLGLLDASAPAVIRDARVYDALVATLARDPGPRAEAALALGRFGDSRAIEPLCAALATPFVAAAAADALAMLPPDPRALEPLQRVLSVDNAHDAPRAAIAIARIPGARASEILLDVVKQGPAFPRGEALAALRKRGEPRLRAALTFALGHGDGSGREWAARSLAALGDRAATPALVGALRDSDWHVVHAAAYALGALRDPAAARALLDLWKRSDERGAAAISDVCHQSLIEIAGRDLGKSPADWSSWKPR
jgi:HEAT repeat protein